eukprot:1151452-Pelagomonas_calceolata.AAC.3
MLTPDIYFMFRGLQGGVWLGAWRWRAEERDPGCPGAWPTTLQIPISFCVMAAPIAADSAGHMMLIIPASLGSNKVSAVREGAVDACSNSLIAILDMTAAISVRSGPPVRDFEHEDWTRLRGGVTRSTWFHNHAVRSITALHKKVSSAYAIFGHTVPLAEHNGH